jgi:hypothetical protein
MTRPLGCNGKYGHSGALRHTRKGQKPCRKCKASRNHYNREYKRKGLLASPRKWELQPCGTPAAAQRHRKRGEPIDFACKVAAAKYKRDRRKLLKENS